MTSPAEGRVARLFAAWNARLPGVGQLSLAGFWLALVTGALLSLDYDHGKAADSLQLLLLTNPAGAFVRGLHYWSAQLFLVTTALHLVEHLARHSETRVRLGSWLRLALSPAVVAYLMVSGYVLKGDAEGALARDVMAGLLDRLPLVGAALHTALVGRGDSLQVLYVQHAATASLLTLAFIVEHFRRPWPSLPAWTSTLAVCTALTAALPPALHDAADAVVKGPWYMLGLQELLHWMGAPALAWLPAVSVLLLLGCLPLLAPPWAARVKTALALAAGGYLVLVVVGGLFRGEGWRWLPSPRWHGGASADARLFLPDPRMARADVPVVLGRREGCLVCHGSVRGLEASHSPQAVGCASCHGGRTWSGHAGLAHQGMVRVPGDLSVARRTCGAGGCHGAIVERVFASPMANGPGLVGVDRFVFGEAATPDGGGSLRRLGSSPADSHLSDLCAGCHLGVEKPAPGPIGEQSRGGGCTACHLGHHEDRSLHPTLTVKVGDEHCFGCHSRSGRISLSYAGWHEPAASDARGPAGVRRRQLADGRVVERHPDDVHHAAGLACVDCHTAREVMGDGREHAHEEEALELACADCHQAGSAESRSWAELDADSQAIVRLRRGQEARRRRFAVTARSGQALTNVVVDADGRVFLEGKLDGRRHPLKPPARACRGMGHDRLSCSACHAAWAPRCLGCHTQLGRDFAWHESGSDFRADAPSLGVRAGRVQPFAPGMILTLGTGPVDLGRAFTPALARAGRLNRLFAPVEPHTTARAGRSCASCHLDPVTLGLGRGALRLETGGEPRFVFEPAGETARDGLPSEAWTAFLADPRPQSSTRSDARPLDAAEQRRILRVGACLGCHEPQSDAGRRIYADFAQALRRATSRCVVPWAPATGSGR